MLPQGRVCLCPHLGDKICFSFFDGVKCPKYIKKEVFFLYLDCFDFLFNFRPFLLYKEEERCFCRVICFSVCHFSCVLPVYRCARSRLV